MSTSSPAKLRHPTENKHYIEFMCPGCNETHLIKVKVHGVPPSGAQWDWNGSYERPTFSPSVLNRTYRYPPNYSPETNPEHAEIRAAFEHGQDGHEWMMRHPKWGRCCHSFVRDGRIQFLNDCTHALAGQTVDLPDYEIKAGA